MENQFVNNQDLDDLLIRYLIDSTSKEERTRVENWLADNQENQRYLSQLTDIYYLGKVTKSPSGFEKEKSLDRVKASYYRNKYSELLSEPKTSNVRRITFRWVTSIAASILIAFSLGLYLRPIINTPPINASIAGIFTEVNSPKGSRTQIILPDGTKVWLNAESKLKYPMEFLKGEREVFLTGEAFFEVTKINKKRFIVRTGDLAIKVWGTKFNVKAYPEEKIIQTTLVEGSVSIQDLHSKDQTQETYLLPRQTAIYYKSAIQKPVEVNNKPNEKYIAEKQEVQIENKVNTTIYTSWKDEKWIIEGETLGSLAIELERRYNVKIDFENNSIKNYRFNGIFRDETFEQLLKIIRLSAPIDYTINNNKVLLKENTNSKQNYDKFLKR